MYYIYMVWEVELTPGFRQFFVRHCGLTESKSLCGLMTSIRRLLHAMRVKDVPHLFVSPSLNAPLYFSILAWLVLIPGVTALFDRIYRPREGDRQPLHFTFRTLRKYAAHRASAVSSLSGSDESHLAFFGTRDHYRRTGIVSIRTWKKHFGQSFEVYDGTHFMEEEHVLSMLVPSILNVLNINK